MKQGKDNCHYYQLLIFHGIKIPTMFARRSCKNVSTIDLILKMVGKGLQV